MSLVPCPFVPLSHVLGAQGVLSITEGDAGSPLRPPTLSFLLPALRGVHQGHAERGAGLRGAAGERSWEPGVRGRTVPESLMWAVGHIWGRGGGTPVWGKPSDSFPSSVMEGKNNLVYFGA